MITSQYAAPDIESLFVFKCAVQSSEYCISTEVYYLLLFEISFNTGLNFTMLSRLSGQQDPKVSLSLNLKFPDGMQTPLCLFLICKQEINHGRS